MSVYDTQPDVYNQKLAEALKQDPTFEVPDWANYVKTGVSRERPPVEEDFWHKRAASILRQIYIHGVVGVGRLRTRYGGRKNKGMKPEHFFKASGKIIRTILQQSDAAGLTEKVKVKKAGRQLTAKGKQLLESIK
jgi:small subunit ribosomal protein S19e